MADRMDGAPVQARVSSHPLSVTHQFLREGQPQVGRIAPSSGDHSTADSGYAEMSGADDVVQHRSAPSPRGAEDRSLRLFRGVSGSPELPQGGGGGSPSTFSSVCTVWAQGSQGASLRLWGEDSLGNLRHSRLLDNKNTALGSCLTPAPALSGSMLIPEIAHGA